MTLSSTKTPRIHSLDGVKGFLSLKTAVSHAGSLVGVPLIPHLVGVGREFTFPILLFAFGIGTGISKRRKPAWPLIVLAITYLLGSIVNEYLVDQLVSRGYGTEHPLTGGFLTRFFNIVTLTRLAHYSDFLQPYIFFLGIALIADRLGKPMRSWNPWALMFGALLLHATGLLLSHTNYHGPMSMLWNGGYRTFQYAPLFAAGVLIGVWRTQLLHSQTQAKWTSALSLVTKLVALKAMLLGAIWLRGDFGVKESLWKDGDLLATACGIIAGILLLTAYDDLKNLVSGMFVGVFERVGRRTIISLCVQIVVLPLAGFAAVQFSSVWVRAAFAVAAFAIVFAVSYNWDALIASFAGSRRLNPEPEGLAA